VRRTRATKAKVEHVAAAVVQSVMMLYGLIAALTAVGVWQRYSQVSDTVSAEATAIASLWRDLGGYPQPLCDQTRDVLRGYSEQIVREAWPKQRRGEIPREGVEWMDRLQTLLYPFEPATESQKIIHAETLRAFNQLVQQRRQRLDCVQAALPSVLWWVLLPGAMGCVVLCLFFRITNARFQAVLTLGLAGFLAMVLFVIIALDRPFCGDMGITADSYQLVIDHHMKK
jgi:fatty acid desaturase